jgi:hypothetical protein
LVNGCGTIESGVPCLRDRKHYGCAGGHNQGDWPSGGEGGKAPPGASQARQGEESQSILGGADTTPTWVLSGQHPDMAKLTIRLPNNGASVRQVFTVWLRPILIAFD